MTRKEFTKICGVLGIGVPLQFPIISWAENGSAQRPFQGKVIIIGAGAGGLSAGYLLQQQGIDFEILEASRIHGGRMRVNTDFADFPIPLGAEWIETRKGIFEEIVNDASVKVDIETARDKPDLKFVNSSWFHFFEKYVVPSVVKKITYNTVVRSVDYSGDQVIVSTADKQYITDKVIFSVPLKILQDGDIDFMPSFPKAKQAVIEKAVIWEGFKAFFEFSTDFI
ncbi:MAG: FAD-dependent oxidoreductase [Bacteroidota bacterium]